jgi:hypothetical protein
MQIKIRLALLAIVVAALSAGEAVATDDKVNLNDWVGNVIKQKVAQEKFVAASTRSNANQSEAPTTSAGTTSLVDTTKASDLIGIALNLAGLSAASGSGGSGDATAGAATASAYTFYSAIRGIDPLDPGEYCKDASRWARKFSFTVGFDDQKNTQPAGNGGRKPIVGGAKALLWSEHDICTVDLKDIQDALETSTSEFATIKAHAKQRLFDLYTKGSFPATVVPAGLKATDFDNQLAKPEVFMKVLELLGAQAEPILLGEASFDEFIALNKLVREKIAEFQQQ